LLVGGKAEPLFVVATDTRENIVYVGQGEQHPGLYRPFVHVAAKDVHWVVPSRALKVGESAPLQVRIRYRQPLQEAVLTALPDHSLRIDFAVPQKAVAPGQFAAWYDGEALLGSGAMAH
jgi:tRNA-specific 2-thiouridylase